MAEFKIPKFKYKGDPIPLDECYRNLSKLSYKSPIEIVYNGFETKLAGDIYEAIHHYGIDFDKDELVKALKYDRNQYEKGFIDGSKLNTDTIKAEVAREIFEEIEQEITEALKSNYKVLPSLEFSNELYNGVRGKIDALRGIEGFIAELKKKYIGEKESNNGADT